MTRASDVLELAQALIRIDTSNPPGRETVAAELLRDWLADRGLQAHLLARDPARANLVAHLPGRGTGPSLALVGHLDVVPADARDWRHDPFAAVVDDDGYLHGRGALDMKNEVAARVVAFAELAADPRPPAGDVWLVLAADEEDGTADVGMRWLVEHHPEVRTDFAVNEGAGRRLALADGRVRYTMSFGEKGNLPVEVTALGEAGHASMPLRGDNAIVRLGQLLGRLGRGVPSRPRPTEHVVPFFDDLLGPQAMQRLDSRALVAGCAALHPVLGHMAGSLLGTTMAPTMLSAGTRLNVMPARATMMVDARVLPGVGADAVLAEVRERLGDDVAYDLVAAGALFPGSAGPPGGPIVEATSAWLAGIEPDAALLPTITTGFTDSVFLRERLGVAAVGFFPAVHTPAEVVESGLHNRDERVHVEDLELGVDYHLHVARSLGADTSSGANGPG